MTLFMSQSNILSNILHTVLWFVGYVNIGALTEGIISRRKVYVDKVEGVGVGTGSCGKASHSINSPLKQKLSLQNVYTDTRTYTVR
jgi:hypothetical protein